MHVGRVYALALRLTGQASMAEEATQEVFIQVWSKLKNYRGDSRFSTWLHSVASNVTISYLRAQKGFWQNLFNIEDSEVASKPAQQCAGSVDLEAYIQRLPERARLVFVLHALEGYRHEDIAEMMDMAVGSSKAQFHRAKQLIKAWMGYGDE
ncbi:RNA polymerase sigma factor [Alteromonas sp. a30]|nr:RNA polymerase sigma factor [Alteromonas sp. a30]